RTIFHFSYMSNHIKMQTMNTKDNSCSFSNFKNFLFNLFASFFNNLFNTSGVYSTVGYKLVQRKTCNFSSNWVKSRKNNSVRRNVHNYIINCRSIMNTNISNFTTNNSSLNLNTYNMKHQNRIFGYMFRSST